MKHNVVIPKLTHGQRMLIDKVIHDMKPKSEADKLFAEYLKENGDLLYALAHIKKPKKK